MSKQMDIKEFRELGYLQEMNRRFLHPLGLAVVVMVHDDGSETLGGIQDARDDPEGFIYNTDAERGVGIDEVKAAYVREQWQARKETRHARLGFVVQPADHEAYDSYDRW